MDGSKWFPEDLHERYEFISCNHAAEILSQAYPEQFEDIVTALREFSISVSDITTPGGNESPIPPKFNQVLDPRDWREIRISGDLLIKFYPRKGKKGNFSNQYETTKTIENFIDGHNIDFLKGEVALDFEWNSKDQTYDRDLFAMRTYYECGIISVGVIVTRSEDLNTVFELLGSKIAQKYGASTTWMGKLTPRLKSRRHGGCPILAIGIKRGCVVDWNGDYEVNLED